MSPASEPSVTVMQVRPARADEQALIRHMVAKARLDPTNLHWQNFLRALLAQGTPPLFLECPAYRVSFYERFGFRLAGFGEIPWVLRLKWLLGNTLVRWLSGVPIRAMRWDGDSPFDKVS